MIPPDFLDLLRCPVTGQSLVVADADLLAKGNARLAEAASRQAKDSAGAGDSGGLRLTEALARADRQVLYPIRDGIPVLLADAAVML